MKKQKIDPLAGQNNPDAPIFQVPREVWLLILQPSTLQDLLKYRTVCHHFEEVVHAVLRSWGLAQLRSRYDLNERDYARMQVALRGKVPSLRLFNKADRTVLHDHYGFAFMHFSNFKIAQVMRTYSGGWACFYSTFHQVKFREMQLAQSSFDRVEFNDCEIDMSLTGATLRNITISHSKLMNLVGNFLKLRVAFIVDTTSSRVAFNEAHFVSVTVQNSVLDYAEFDGATLVGCRFNAVNLLGAQFKKAELLSVVFDHCNLNAADLSDCKMSDVRFINCTMPDGRKHCDQYFPLNQTIERSATNALADDEHTQLLMMTKEFHACRGPDQLKEILMHWRILLTEANELDLEAYQQCRHLAIQMRCELSLDARLLVTQAYIALNKHQDPALALKYLTRAWNIDAATVDQSVRRYISDGALSVIYDEINAMRACFNALQRSVGGALIEDPSPNHSPHPM